MIINQSRSESPTTGIVLLSVSTDNVVSHETQRQDHYTTIAVGESEFDTVPSSNSTEKPFDTLPEIGKIGMAGSIAIAVNSLAGPAMLNLPATYQRSGLIPTTVALIVACILASLCSLHMANVVTKVPGNHSLEHHIEFSDPFRIFWGRKSFIFTQVTFFLCTTCLNLSAIVDTAQIIDTIMGHSIGSVALRFRPGPLALVRWRHGACTEDEFLAGECFPFDNGDGMAPDIIFTAGYLVAGLIFIPFSLMDLKENTNFQIFGMFVLLVNSGLFAIFFLSSGLSLDNVSFWGTSGDWDTMIGVILFNFTLALAIPAWMNDKSEHVGVPKVVNTSSIIATSLYVVVGALGALAIPNVSINMLKSMTTGAFGVPAQITASFFAFFVIGLDIPLFSVLTRLNLTGSGLCSRTKANILVVYIPWAIAWMFYQGDGIYDVLSWGGVLFTGAVAFIMPLLLALYILLNYSDTGSIDVYSGHLKTLKAQRIALYVTLGTAVLAILIAFVGQAHLS